MYKENYMGYCENHGLDYGWTCPVCEISMEYVGRSWLLDHFDDGYKNPDKNFSSLGPEAQGAFAHGARIKNPLRDTKKKRKRQLRRVLERISQKSRRRN
jgi:hypothetical protein